ncbi:MAG: antitoxin [Actinobacteria bacterium]|nr:antitoxin [Actinomycetota bacterium]
MTMLSFRVGGDEATAAQQWADELGIDKSELLREALHRHLTLLASEHEADKWVETPLTADELALGRIAAWGPAEDWSDWVNAAR